MIAGGAEGAISTLGVGGFAAMKALSTRNDDPATASRPWDKGRDGFVIGEGAGVLVLEELEHAKKRGAKIYAEIVGFGMSSDAYHITAPNEEGPALAVTRALKDAGLNPEDVDYVNAHGTSTPLGDANETKALKRAFGEHAYKTVVSSTKSMTGHLLGAAGGVEAVYSILAIHDGKVPPTINIFEQDIEAGCDLDYCANEARDAEIDVAISNSFGFGGTNGTLVFKRFKDWLPSVSVKNAVWTISDGILKTSDISADKTQTIHRLFDATDQACPSYRLPSDSGTKIYPNSKEFDKAETELNSILHKYRYNRLNDFLTDVLPIKLKQLEGRNLTSEEHNLLQDANLAFQYDTRLEMFSDNIYKKGMNVQSDILKEKFPHLKDKIISANKPDNYTENGKVVGLISDFGAVKFIMYTNPEQNQILKTRFIIE